MSQQINLYQPMFRKSRVVFSAATIALVALGLLALLLLWAGLTSQRVASLESELQSRRDNEQVLAARVTELSRTIGERTPSAALAEEVERMEARLDALERSRDQVRNRIPDQAPTLVAPMRSLAIHHPDGLWLTGIELAANGTHLVLRGRALDAELLPDYLQRLQDDPVHANRTFNQFSVRRSSDEWPGVEFMVSTQSGESP